MRDGAAEGQQNVKSVKSDMRALMRIPRAFRSQGQILSQGFRSTSAAFDEKEVYTNPNVDARKKENKTAAGKGNQRQGARGQQGLFKRLRSEVNGEKRQGQGQGDRLRNRKPSSSPQRGGSGGAQGGVNAKGGTSVRSRSGAGPRLGAPPGGDGGGRDGRQKKWINRGGGKGIKGRRDKDHSRGDYSGDGVPEAIQALLYDHEFFKAQALKGKRINTRDMDGIDAFFAQSFMESNKTDSSEVLTVIEDDTLRRTQLPQPRSMDKLFQDTYGMIGDIDGRLNKYMGDEFATNLNEVLQRNVYYSDEEKKIYDGYR